MSYRTLNPATEELVRTYPEHSWKEAKEAARAALEAFSSWREVPFHERSTLFKKLATLLRAEKENHASWIVREMGKPVSQAEAEIEKCAVGCEYYAENAEKSLTEEVISTDAGKSYVRYDPLGPILGIMPWNFPFWQVFRFAVPALMAGNVALLKPAPNVPGCALEIAKIFQKAGFPDGVFQTLFLNNETTARLIESGAIQGVSLTGSTQAGREVAQIAGRSLIKTVLELGGSDPFVVFDDADLEKTIPIAIRARMLNTGQSCIAAKRFILMKGIAPRFKDLFLKAVKNLKTGDPNDRKNDLGPLAREDLLLNLMKQVEGAVASGAKVLLGGKRIERKGYFYEPTMLEGAISSDQEIFGPVAVLMTAVTEEEAIELANRTCYGLGASLWTENVSKAEGLAKRIEAGSVFINGMVHSDPRLPFGGIKQSGYGRELSVVGLREFVNIKTVWIA